VSTAPIDAVVTWVDGADPAHAARLREFLGARDDAVPVSADPTRFNDAGELDWCLASLLRHAPWLRTIHVVTDRQVPPALAKLAGTPYAGRVRVVDHAQVFAGYEAFLPTFNSRAISAMLWRIPDLAEDFLYVNDDFAVVQPVQPTDFFRDGRVVLRGRWKPQSAHQPLRRVLEAVRRWRGAEPSRAARMRVRNRTGQENGARAAGFEREYLRLAHHPHPMRRSTLAAFFAEQPDRLEQQIRHRLRSADQFNAESLSAHLEIARFDAIVDNRLRTLTLKPSEQWLPRLRRLTARADADAACAFACVQSLELAPAAARAHVAAWLDRRVGGLPPAGYHPHPAPPATGEDGTP
jgi:hypothetical protein